ncbi:hypothetical protein AAY473_005744 [Plecturocebus cupreus]
MGSVNSSIHLLLLNFSCLQYRDRVSPSWPGCLEFLTLSSTRLGLPKCWDYRANKRKCDVSEREPANLLGTTEVSSICTQSSPLEKFSACSTEGSNAAKRHTIAFTWGNRLICPEMTPACIIKFNHNFTVYILMESIEGHIGCEFNYMHKSQEPHVCTDRSSKMRRWAGFGKSPQF